LIAAGVPAGPPCAARASLHGSCSVQRRFIARAHHDAMIRFVLLLSSTLWLGTTQAQTLVARASAGQVADRVLQLVNQARSQGRRCGEDQFSPTAPLASAIPLDSAAQSHARDMASREYFAHRSKDGRQPRDRIRTAGYAARLSGENIAFGPESAEEVVTGWLNSPGHCANLMDPRFRHMGIGFATARQAGHIYWVQTLGAPGGP
jgi:uncharacterized protein YkwD